MKQIKVHCLSVSEALSQLRCDFDSQSVDLRTFLPLCVLALEVISEFKSCLLHNSLEGWVLLHIWISFHPLSTAVKQMLLINWIQT